VEKPVDPATLVEKGESAAGGDWEEAAI